MRNLDYRKQVKKKNREDMKKMMWGGEITGTEADCQKKQNLPVNEVYLSRFYCPEVGRTEL